jgi:uncharacterized protein YbjT (DUF2867 family)
MTPTILVTGGTGTLGRLVVRRLAGAGCDVRVLSRRGHAAEDGIEFVTGDLDTGKGIEAAVDGAEIIVHLAGSPKGDEDKARTLVRAASSQASPPHLVYISVVGADRIPVVSRVDRAMFGYFGSKREAERVVADSGLPWTTLRATQFHDLILTVARQMAKLPVVPIPAGFRVQPVDADEVAARLVELALGEPAWCPTWAGRGCTAWPSCCAYTSRSLSGGGRSCRSGCRAAPPECSGTAPTWLPSGQWDTGLGKSSSRTGSSRATAAMASAGAPRTRSRTSR